MQEKPKVNKAGIVVLLILLAVVGIVVRLSIPKADAGTLSSMSKTNFYPAKYFKSHSNLLVKRQGTSTSNYRFNQMGSVCKNDSSAGGALIPPANSPYKYQIRSISKSSSSVEDGGQISSSNKNLQTTISTLASTSLRDVWTGRAATKYYYFNLANGNPEVTYSNYLIYDTKSKTFKHIDVHLKVLGYGESDKHAYALKGHKCNPYIAIEQTIHGLPAITILNVASVKIKYNFYLHGTSTPYNIRTSFTYTDFDRRQAISVDEDSGKGFMISNKGSTKLYFGEYKGYYSVCSNEPREVNQGGAGYYDTMMGFMISGTSSTWVYTSDQMPTFNWNGLRKGQQNSNYTQIAPPNGTHSYFGTSVIRNKVVPDMGAFTKSVSDASSTAYSGTDIPIGTDATREDDGNGTTDSYRVSKESAAATGQSNDGVTHNRMDAAGTSTKKNGDLMYYVLQQVIPPNMGTSSSDAHFAKSGLTFTDNLDSCLTFAGTKGVKIYTVSADSESESEAKRDVKNLFKISCDKDGHFKAVLNSATGSDAKSKLYRVNNSVGEGSILVIKIPVRVTGNQEEMESHVGIDGVAHQANSTDKYLDTPNKAKMTWTLKSNDATKGASSDKMSGTQNSSLVLTRIPIRETKNVRISKTVTGLASDQDKDFTFHATVTGAAQGGSYTVSKNGETIGTVGNKAA